MPANQGGHRAHTRDQQSPDSGHIPWGTGPRWRSPGTGKVFVVTPNAHVLALDARTGQCVWDKTYGDVRAGESATVAPLIVKNMVIVGAPAASSGCAATLTHSRSTPARFAGTPMHPHDVWDYDSIAECILFESDGRKLLGHFDKNGYFFVLDRTNGALVRVTPFVDRITWGEITSDGKVTAKVYLGKEGSGLLLVL